MTSASWQGKKLPYSLPHNLQWVKNTRNSIKVPLHQALGCWVGLHICMSEGGWTGTRRGGGIGERQWWCPWSQTPGWDGWVHSPRGHSSSRKCGTSDSSLLVAVMPAGRGDWGITAVGTVWPRPCQVWRALDTSPLPSAVASINLTTPERQWCPQPYLPLPSSSSLKRDGSAWDTDSSGCCRGARHPGAHFSKTSDSRDTDSRAVSDPRAQAVPAKQPRSVAELVGETVQALRCRGEVCAVVPPAEEEKKGL